MRLITDISQYTNSIYQLGSELRHTTMLGVTPPTRIYQLGSELRHTTMVGVTPPTQSHSISSNLCIEKAHI